MGSTTSTTYLGLNRWLMATRERSARWRQCAGWCGGMLSFLLSATLSPPLLSNSRICLRLLLSFCSRATRFATNLIRRTANVWRALFTSPNSGQRIATTRLFGWLLLCCLSIFPCVSLCSPTTAEAGITFIWSFTTGKRGDGLRSIPRQTVTPEWLPT